MDRISFDIFIPDRKKFHLTPNWIVYILWFVTIGFFWAFEKYLPSDGEIRKVTAWSVGIISLYFLFTSFFKYRPLNGIMEGKILFAADSLVINNKTYELKNITKLDFNFGDYYGERSTSGRDFNPKIYQGVSNSVTFTDNTNQVHEVYFRMMDKHSSMALYSFINEAVKAGSMSYYRATDLVGAENVQKLV